MIHTGALIAGYWDKEAIPELRELPFIEDRPVPGWNESHVKLEGPLSAGRLLSFRGGGDLILLVTEVARFPALLDAGDVRYILISPADLEALRYLAKVRGDSPPFLGIPVIGESAGVGNE